MKKIFLIVIFSVFIYTAQSWAQDSVNSDNGAVPANHVPVNEKASFAGALLILMALGIGYSAKKIYVLRSSRKEE